MTDEIIQRAKELGVSPGHLERVAYDDGGGWGTVGCAISGKAAELYPDATNDGVVWQSVGRFDFDARGEFWKRLLDEPGLYRLKFEGNIYYVGQTKSLYDRLGAYHTPGHGVEVDHRIHRALKKLGAAEVETLSGGKLHDPSLRLALEKAEIETLIEAGNRLLNGDCIENLRDRIEYHEDQITRLKIKIAERIAKGES